MSSAFVPTVERVNNLRSRGGRKPQAPSRPVAGTSTLSPASQLGKRSSAALQTTRGLWDWDWLTSDEGVPLRVHGEPSVIYPATRDITQPPVFPLDVVLSSATSYIHNTPDIVEPDAVAELVMEELTKHYADPEPIPDVDVGRTVAVIQHPSSRLARTLLAFPTGAVGHQLNISPFLPLSTSRHHSRAAVTLSPMETPMETFSTSILQLESSPFITSHEVDALGTALLVRIAMCTYMLNVIPNPNFIPSTMASPIDTIRVGELPISATEDRTHVDVVLDPIQWSRAAVVDDGGGVWLWYEVKTKMDYPDTLLKSTKLVKVRDAVGESDGFFRISFGPREDTLLVLTRTSLTVIDFASSPATEQVILTTTADNPFSAIDKSVAARGGIAFICVASRRELIWVDDRGDQPVLRWAHNLKSQDDLDLLVVPPSHSPDHPHSDMVLVFSAELGTSQGICVTNDRPGRLRASVPWSLGPLSLPLRSPVLLPFHNRRGYRGWVHFAASAPGGAIQLVELASDATQERRNRLMGATKASAPEDRVEKKEERPLSEKAEARHQLLSARWAWSQINESESQETRLHALAFVQDLRENDSHLEHVLTAAELARDQALGPQRGKSSHLRRLDFYDTPEQRDVLANLNYAGTFPFVCDTTHSLKLPAVENMTIAIPSAQTRYAVEASRLKADLALSGTSVWSQWLAPGATLPKFDAEEDELFAAAAGQLSLEESKRPIERDRLHILQPRTEGRNVAGNPPADFGAARGLLGEWSLGDSVKSYQWSSPDLTGVNGSSSGTEFVNRRPIKPLPSSFHSQPLPGSSQHRTIPLHAPIPVPAVVVIPSVLSSIPIPSVIPAFVASPAARPRPSVPLRHSGSLAGFSRSSPPLPHSQEESQSQSQGEFPQTQAERGPFGARPEAAVRVKKKAVKKRAGGF